MSSNASGDRQRVRTLARIGAIAAFVVIASAPLACSDVAGPDDIPAIIRDTTALFQTDSLAYTLLAGDEWYSGKVGVTFTNRTSGTVYFVNCLDGTGLRLEKRVAGQWV